MQIDHVLLTASNLDVTARRLFETYGLASVPGGAHPWGTANRIVPLGGPYLEIIGVTDAALAETNPIGQWVRAASAEGDQLAALMVTPDDFDATCARLSLTPTAGQRARPDGVALSWRLGGMVEALARSWPCFISWDARDETFDGDAGVGASGIAALELGGATVEISAWLGGEVDGLKLVGGAPGIRRLVITTGSGEIVLPQHPFAGHPA